MAKWWNTFWFESNQPENVRTFRFYFGLTLFAFYFLRTFDFSLFYFDAGVMPLSAVFDIFPMEYRTSLFFYLTKPIYLWLGHVVFLASLLLFAFGVAPRIFAFIAFVLQVSFMNRNLAIVYGADFVAIYYLFYLCFVDGKKKNSAIGSIAYRFMQIQVCLIYTYAGLDKVRGTLWWKGEALWNVFANPQMVYWRVPFIEYLPLFIVAGSYLTLIWEIYFGVFVWIKPIKIPTLFFGAIFHVIIWFLVGIPFFSILMILTYILFLDSSELKRFKLKPLLAIR